jgi:type VI secretion system secreted protein Hcp
MAFDAFLKLDGIKGESQDKTHKDEIELHSFSWGATNAGSMASGGGGGTGKVSMSDFHFTKPHSVASPKLMQSCATGDHIKSAILTVRKAGGSQLEFLKIKLTDVLVSSYQTGGNPKGDTGPMDQVSINFGKIEHEYSPQKSDGSLGASIHGGFDVKGGVKV